WWPNGFGEPSLYRLVMALLDPSGEVVDERTTTIGFRNVELVANEGAPVGARPYTFVVNGRRTYIRGWNWVPVDVMYGVPRRDLVRHLVRLAREARANLLRVWGGGLIEDDTFYDACDRAGIMVWQELSQSSSGFESTPASDEEFITRMVAETEAIAPSIASHPSLVAWCGGNELEDESGPLDERHPLLAALRDTIARVDPGRIWLPTSPTGPRFNNTVENIEHDPDGLHDVHGPWEHQGLRAHQELYDRGTSLLNSEFGVEGMTNRRTLEATVSPPRREPPTRDNPVYRHRGDWWINEPLVQSAFGGRLADLEQVRRASQMLQADGLRYAVEANRRRAFRNSGSIPWQLNESYPNAWCTAAVDHRGDPKPAYFAVRRAYEAVHVAARFDTVAWAGESAFRANVWTWSDVEPIDGAAVRVALRGMDGSTLSQGFGTVDLPIGTPVPAFDLAVDVPQVPLFVLDLELAGVDGRRLSANRYLFASGPDLGALVDLAPAHIAADCRPRDDIWRLNLRHVSGPAAIALGVLDHRAIDEPGWAEPSDGALILMPGETIDVGVAWANAPVDGRRVAVSGWNVDAIHVA
ncbi:MAG TPA: glycoside hydrolase family 2 TIM barrel-domain containing protein, partial [Candidatus Limnocylindrales bacterium]|nr:glycoside hydrolase family 2 TIM barrel-domain containing protein [Candidatus Limnocylindrales bacterium]